MMSVTDHCSDPAVGFRFDHASRLRGTFNSLLLVSILVVSALFQSELGGPDSVFNALDVIFIALFILFNRSVRPMLVLAFALPVLCLALSVVLNIDTIAIGGLRSAGATAIGFALFVLKPVPLNRRLLRRLVLLYVLASLLLSVWVLIDRQVVNFSQEVANDNFNGNPNSAALFFVALTMLSLAIVRDRLGWILTIPSVLLTLTTGSRAGAVGTALIVLSYAIVTTLGNGGSEGAGRQRLASIGRAVIFAGATAILAISVIPDAIAFLTLRFDVGTSRTVVWTEGLESVDSFRSLAFGIGPASLAARSGTAVHSSYLEAVGNSGVFFLLTAVIAVLVWLRSAVRDGGRELLWIVPPVLLYGTVETILFNGISTIWLLTMLFGIIIESGAAGLDTSGLEPGSRPPARDLSSPARRLVVDASHDAHVGRA